MGIFIQKFVKKSMIMFILCTHLLVFFHQPLIFLKIPNLFILYSGQ